MPNLIFNPNRINESVEAPPAPPPPPPPPPPPTGSVLTVDTTGLADVLAQQTVSGYTTNFRAADWSLQGIELVTSKENPATPKFRSVARRWLVGVDFEFGASFRFDASVSTGPVWIGWSAILKAPDDTLWELPLRATNLASPNSAVVLAPFLGESWTATNPDTGTRYVTAANGGNVVTLRNPTGVYVPSGSQTVTHRLTAVTLVIPAAPSATPAVRAAWFRRKVGYAPKGSRDTRIESRIFLELAEPLPAGANVLVTTPGRTDVLLPGESWAATADPRRLSEAIHVNQVAYSSAHRKVAMIGMYLGNGGELRVDDLDTYNLIDALTGAVVFTGRLAWRRDQFWPSNVWGQQVKVADFSTFQTPGYYQVQVPGLGCSFPFHIDDLAFLGWLRLVLRGIMNMRCGQAIDIPYTRQEHVACHAQNAIIPSPQADFDKTWGFIGGEAGNPPASQTADVPTSESQLISGYARTGNFNATGGHHDAGDYGRYTFTVAMTVHHLVLAADLWGANFDNLGIPESGNGRCDLLDEAKIDADLLLKLQDTDGGFYTLLRPVERKYDDDQDLSATRPGDPMAAYPKSTQATAAAVAALAQIGSSPVFRAQFGNAAADAYLAAAQTGWAWIQGLFTAFGRNGAFQKIWHYGMMFSQDDELAWAAVELYLATGNEAYHNDVLTMPSYTTGVPFNPLDTRWRKWGWWQMYECVGAAARSYALSHKTGRNRQRDPVLFQRCTNALIEAAEWRLANTQGSAFGNGLTSDYKRNTDAGWWFSCQQGFDLAAAYELQTDPDKRQAYLNAYVENWGATLGCNAVNVTFLGGCGLRNHRDCVNQYQQVRKLDRTMPPTGFLTGELNKQAFYYLAGSYLDELKKLIYPNVQAVGNANRTPLPERWWDGFDVLREVTIWEASAAAAGAAWLASLVPAGASQAYTGLLGTISGIPASLLQNSPVAAVLTCAGLSNTELDKARVVWELRGVTEPFQGGVNSQFIRARTLTFNASVGGECRLEAEAHLPDGRIVLARKFFTSQIIANRQLGDFLPGGTGGILARWTFDAGLTDSVSGGLPFSIVGAAFRDSASWVFPGNPSGGCFRCLYEIGNRATQTLAGNLLSTATGGFAVEFMIFVRSWMRNVEAGNHVWFSFGVANESKQFKAVDGQYRAGRSLKGNNPGALCTGTQFDSLFQTGTWNHLRFICDSAGQRVFVNGVQVGSGYASTSALAAWLNPSAPLVLQFGDFDGWIDDLVIRAL